MGSWSVQGRGGGLGRRGCGLRELPCTVGRSQASGLGRVGVKPGYPGEAALLTGLGREQLGVFS